MLAFLGNGENRLAAPWAVFDSSPTYDPPAISRQASERRLRPPRSKSGARHRETALVRSGTPRPPTVPPSHPNSQIFHAARGDRIEGSTTRGSGDSVPYDRPRGHSSGHTRAPTRPHAPGRINSRRACDLDVLTFDRTAPHGQSGSRWEYSNPHHLHCVVVSTTFAHVGVVLGCVPCGVARNPSSVRAVRGQVCFALRDSSNRHGKEASAPASS